jgi:hypothetical protein
MRWNEWKWIQTNYYLNMIVLGVNVVALVLPGEYSYLNVVAIIMAATALVYWTYYRRRYARKLLLHSVQERPHEEE